MAARKQNQRRTGRAGKTRARAGKSAGAKSKGTLRGGAGSSGGSARASIDPFFFKLTA